MTEFHLRRPFLEVLGDRCLLHSGATTSAVLPIVSPSASSAGQYQEDSEYEKQQDDRSGKSTSEADYEVDERITDEHEGEVEDDRSSNSGPSLGSGYSGGSSNSGPGNSSSGDDGSYSGPGGGDDEIQSGPGGEVDDSHSGPGGGDDDEDSLSETDDEGDQGESGGGPGPINDGGNEFENNGEEDTQTAADDAFAPPALAPGEITVQHEIQAADHEKPDGNSDSRATPDQWSEDAVIRSGGARASADTVEKQESSASGDGDAPANPPPLAQVVPGRGEAEGPDLNPPLGKEIVAADPQSADVLFMAADASGVGEPFSGLLNSLKERGGDWWENVNSYPGLFWVLGISTGMGAVAVSWALYPRWAERRREALRQLLRWQRPAL